MIAKNPRPIKVHSLEKPCQICEQRHTRKIVHGVSCCAECFRAVFVPMGIVPEDITPWIGSRAPKEE